MLHYVIGLTNRVGGIFAWVGLWNIIVIFVKETDLISNVLLFILGVLIWMCTNEFTTI